MTAPAGTPQQGTGRFRLKLLVAMMLVVSAVTLAAMYFTGRSIASNAENVLEQQFQAELDAMHRTQELRHAVLAERCRALVRRPRIHAALEDDALDLLYLSAKDELFDVMARGDEESIEPGTHALHARFYRFLDSEGHVIPAGASTPDVGALLPEEEQSLALPSLPKTEQMGAIVRHGPRGVAVDEIIAMPIISSETGEVISALVVGFKPPDVGARQPGMANGAYVHGSLHLPGLPSGALSKLGQEVALALSSGTGTTSRISVAVADVPHLMLYELSNPGSMFPPVYEVSLFSLADSLAQQRQWRRQIGWAGLFLMLCGLVLSNSLARRLAVPVERLEVDSREQREQRVMVEAALEQTNVELQRSVRFSADASHQLKTPVAVLRAGLEELLTHDGLDPLVRDEISGLIHQTFRLTGMIEDLLLLSRMDAGRLQLDFSPVNLTQLVEACVDDVTAMPDEIDIEVQTDVPVALKVAGEKAYTALMLQNLLENARKYNRPGGLIKIRGVEEGDIVRLFIGNTGRTIPKAAQEHIFERFHRGAEGENVPGHGLGLNLARELALIHGGDLHLVLSKNDWTEFEVCFRSARAAPPARLELA